MPVEDGFILSQATFSVIVHSNRHSAEFGHYVNLPILTSVISHPPLVPKTSSYCALDICVPRKTSGQLDERISYAPAYISEVDRT
jgi:hypothetical protein